MKNKKITRFIFLYIFTGIVFVTIIARLFYLQAVKCEESESTVLKSLSLTEKDTAPRGRIYDRNGNLLVSNRQGYIVLIKKGSEESLDLTLKNLELITSVTAEELKTELKENGFSYNNPFVFMQDAEKDIVIKLKESPEKYPCIEILTAPVREYLYPDVAVHLLGRCGMISKEEYEKLSGYSRNDIIGKQGVEKAFENILRGKDGVRAKEKYTNGEVKKFSESIPPEAGSDIFLTIDLNLQKSTEDALSDVIKTQKDAVGGAVVITDVNSGEVLALASYPDYNTEDFNKNYKTLSQDRKKPMFNRALAGLYEPGSTFKPITAIAALETGNLTPDEKIKTLGKYEYFDRVFRCNIYREKGKTHGRIDVKDALSVSCNYFFYELGKRVGIDEIYNFAHAFGLDNATGIELTKEEATGTIASPKERKSRGGYWYAGDTLQAAIGQSDNQFTPIALANYSAVLANGGTLYSAHILKGTEKNKKTTCTKPKILNTLDISEKTMQTIREGMLSVTKSGTAKDVFSDFPTDIAGKTGTAQKNGRTNGLFIGFAPAESPKIAFCVVVEGGASGNQAAHIIKNIIKNYSDTNEKGN